MTGAALMTLILAHGCVPPALAPIAVGIAMHESGGNTLAMHRNTNGTIDYGLAQINSVNFAWLATSMHTPINPQSILEPCTNLQAALRVLFVRYNGNPPDDIKVTYAAAALSKFDGVEVSAPKPIVPACAPAWDAWAIATCNRPASALTPATAGASVVAISTKKADTP